MVAVPFIEKDNSFSPQKSAVSVVVVRAYDTVSLKVYWFVLETLNPANATRFSIEEGAIDNSVSKHGSKVVN